MFNNKKFLLLFSAHFFSAFGDAILFVILLSMLQTLGGTGVDTSLYFLFSALPVLLFGLHIGAFVEAKPLQKIMVSSDAIRIALLLLFYYISYFQNKSVLIIYVLIFLITLVNAFFTTSSASLIPHIIDSQSIPKANGLFRIINMTGKLIAYSFAALLFKFGFTIYDSLLVVTIFYFASLLTVFFIQPAYQNNIYISEKVPLVNSIKEGLLYIKKDRIIFRLFIIYFLGWMVGSAIDIYLISYLKVIYGKGAEYFFLFTTPTILGIVIGSLISPFLYNNLNKKYGFLISLFAFSFAILCFALKLPLPLLQFLLIVGGVSQGILNIFVVSYLQTNVQGTHLARVFSVYHIISVGGGIPGYLLFGYLIDLIGIISLGFILSAYLLIIGIACLLLLPSMETTK